MPTSHQPEAPQTLVGGMAMDGLRGRSEPEAKAARMRERAGRCGRGAQGAEQAEGPAIAMPLTSGVYSIQSAA